MKALVAGWFSFEEMGATAGDLLARELACSWLEEAGYEYELALAAPFAGGVDWRTVDPEAYSHVLFVCGPFGNGPPIPEFLSHFSGRRLLGLNLSMLDPLAVWNPFDRLWERDSSTAARPDVTFLAPRSRVPVVGVVLVHPQREYKARALHRQANEAIERLVAGREMAVVQIDTRLDENRTGLRTPGEVQSLVARMDVVLTTRLHGLVLSLKNGVPAVAIDPIAGGAKIHRQAETIGWPAVFTADALSDQALAQAYEYCLTDEARAKARECTDRAIAAVCRVREELIEVLAADAVFLGRSDRVLR
jgi:hypothetical protein